MSPLIVLFRKQLNESRWTLGLCCSAFAALSAFTINLTSRTEALLASGPKGSDLRRLGFLQFLGGPAMDRSTTAIEICWWNHPVIVLTVLAWATVRGAGAISGEIERGTIDVTLSRAISRSTYLASQVLFMLFSLTLLIGSLVLGNIVSTPFFKLDSPPSLLALLKPSAIVLATGFAVFGYTLPFSALDVVRWRPMVLSGAITLLGLIGMTFAPQYDGYEWLERISVFQAYAPVTIALKTDPLLYNSTVLMSVFAVGVAISYAIFAIRDIPSNS